MVAAATGHGCMGVRGGSSQVSTAIKPAQLSRQLSSASELGTGFKAHMQRRGTGVGHGSSASRPCHDGAGCVGGGGAYCKPPPRA